MHFLLLAIFLCTSASCSKDHEEHLSFPKLYSRLNILKKRQVEEEYLEQCGIIDFTEENKLKRVNVLAFLDVSLEYSHRQAAMLKDLKERFERFGMTDINFFVVNSIPSTITKRTEILLQSFRETLGDEIYLVQDDSELQIWKKLHVSRDQILVVDGCGKLAYQVIVPWSILHFPYVKAAILSTYNDEPCGPCRGSNLEKTTHEPINDKSFMSTLGYDSTLPDETIGERTKEIDKTERVTETVPTITTDVISTILEGTAEQRTEEEMKVSEKETQVEKEIKKTNQTMEEHRKTIEEQRTTEDQKKVMEDQMKAIEDRKGIIEEQIKVVEEQMKELGEEVITTTQEIVEGTISEAKTIETTKQSEVEETTSMTMEIATEQIEEIKLLQEGKGIVTKGMKTMETSTEEMEATTTEEMAKIKTTKEQMETTRAEKIEATETTTEQTRTEEIEATTTIEKIETTEEESETSKATTIQATTKESKKVFGDSFEKGFTPNSQSTQKPETITPKLTLDLLKNLSKAPIVPSLSNSKNQEDFNQSALTEKEEETTNFPIRIIMKAPHLHIYENSVVKHDSLILKTDNPDFHDHLEDGVNVKFPMESFTFDEKSNDFQKLMDILTLDNRQLLNQMNQRFNNDTNSFQFQFEPDTKDPRKIKKLIYGRDEGPGIFEALARDDSEFLQINMEEKLEQPAKDEEMTNVSSDFDGDGQEEEEKSKLIAHYNKLLPWINFVLN